MWADQLREKAKYMRSEETNAVTSLTAIPKEVSQSVIHETQKWTKKLVQELKDGSISYKWKQYDVSKKTIDGKLVSRDGLLDVNDVILWESETIAETFKLLAISKQTQIEPMYPPQYVWETYEKNWETFRTPTYIIVWDIPMGAYNIWNEEGGDLFIKKLLKDNYGDRFLIEKDEWFAPEVDALSSLWKLGIGKVWITNMNIGSTEREWYWIYDGLTQKGMDVYWLDDNKISMEYADKERYDFYYQLHIFQAFWVDLETLPPITDDEFVRIWEKYYDIFLHQWAHLRTEHRAKISDAVLNNMIQLNTLDNWNDENEPSLAIKEIAQHYIYENSKYHSAENFRVLKKNAEISYYNEPEDYGFDAIIENMTNNTLAMNSLSKYASKMAVNYANSNRNNKWISAVMVPKTSIWVTIATINELHEWDVNIYTAK